MWKMLCSQRITSPVMSNLAVIMRLKSLSNMVLFLFWQTAWPLLHTLYFHPEMMLRVPVMSFTGKVATTEWFISARSAPSFHGLLETYLSTSFHFYFHIRSSSTSHLVDSNIYSNMRVHSSFSHHRESRKPYVAPSCHCRSLCQYFRQTNTNRRVLTENINSQGLIIDDYFHSVKLNP